MTGRATQEARRNGTARLVLLAVSPKQHGQELGGSAAGGVVTSHGFRVASREGLREARPRGSGRGSCPMSSRVTAAVSSRKAMRPAPSVLHSPMIVLERQPHDESDGVDSAFFKLDLSSSVIVATPNRRRMPWTSYMSSRLHRQGCDRPMRTRPLIKRTSVFIGGLAIVATLSFPAINRAVAQTAGLALDGTATTHQTARGTSITSAALTTTQANDLIVAFIDSDGPKSAGGQSISSVTGGGLSWKLRQRTNAQPGTAEIWEAVAASKLTGVAVTATRSTGSYTGSIVVEAFSGADTAVDGAVGTRNATTGGPNVSLTASRTGSWVWGVGNDWDNATNRTVGAGQTLVDQYLPNVGDTYWVQSQTSAGNTAGSNVVLNDTAPTNDHWDYSAIEILPANADTIPPSVPANFTAVANNSNQVALNWQPSTDNVGVTGYKISRNGAALPNAVTNSYTDNSVSPSTTYNYTVQAYDAANNVSNPAAASVTTPAPVINNPIISNVVAGSVTSSSVTITWITDIPSSSQIFYGPSSSYGQNTALDTTQVTSHSQTITGLGAGAYHFDVQSTGTASNTSTSSDGTFTIPPVINLPVIGNIAAGNITTSSVTITWTTDIPASSQVLYGPTSAYGQSTALDTTLVTSHSQTINGLAAGAYHYAVQSTSSQSNTSTSADGTFIIPPPITNPVISNVASGAITTSSATITWNTDIPSSSQIFYGTTAAYDQSTTLDTTQVTNHSQTISGLSAGTYHYQVQSTGTQNNTGVSADNTFTISAANITLPDMRLMVPTNRFTIGTNTTTGNRQLQFTHITWDGGTGPFEIDPTYNSVTGIASFTQAIYSSPSAGVWVFDHQVPVAATGTWEGHGDYNFPLNYFSLNNVNPDGTIGSVVAVSPKTDYCMTADTKPGGVPNTPSISFIPASNCTGPNNPLGWSVGWGDAYDNTDPGQPIDLTGVPDGTYILHGVTDPQHVFTETNPNNNITDTVIQITGNTVTVLSQSDPGVTLPVVSIISPTNGATVTGTVSVSATASATAPATVTSLQFFLDGQPLGGPITNAPYNLNWTVGSTTPGNHLLSAQVTDSNGSLATSTPITVVVPDNNPPPPPPDTTPPTVNISNPANSQTVYGTIPIAANASDNVAVASVQFMLDGQPLGIADTASPYAVNLDTTTLTGGLHSISAVATDTSGNTASATAITVNVDNVSPPPACFTIDSQQSVHGHGNLSTSVFGTALADEWLFAFVSADGPNGAGRQTATVTSTGSLTWTLVKRSNGVAGDAEIWAAHAVNQVNSISVTSTLASTNFDQDLTVMAMEMTNGVGTSVAASASTGAPSTNLTTTNAGSLVFAVGHDWDGATARTLPAGWASLDQWVDTKTGDTTWVQYTNNPIPGIGTNVLVNDLAPTNHQWNVVALEVLPDTS
jgi:hypothetical protein